MKTAKVTEPEKKKYKQEILNTYKYRGFKINEVLNKKTRRREFKVRFQINNKEIYLTDERRKNLEEMIDEMLVQERRAKYDLPTPKHSPTLEEFFERATKKISLHSEKTTLERGYKILLDAIEAETGNRSLRVTELRRAHLQLFLDERLKTVKPESANREMTSIAAALHKADRLYPELEKWICPKIPRVKIKRRRRERLITPGEIEKLLSYLTRPQELPQERPHHYFYRVRLAHTIEFTLHTGLRRQEAAALKKSQYDRERRALLEVKRGKTKTVTKFFPLTGRAVEIIEARIKLQKDSEYIFTADGLPVQSHYRHLKIICEQLGIPYGQNHENGFVLHDARHNFATAIVKLTDIETARELTGHAGEEILTYLHTTENDLIRAMQAFEGANVRETLRVIFDEVKANKLDFEKFLERIKNMAIFGASRANAETLFANTR